MKRIAILGILFSFHFSLAGLAGDWTGFGNWTFKGEGDGMDCSAMTMSWSESADTLALEKGHFDCDYVTMDIDRVTWVLKDGQLFDESGAEVGRYDGTTLSVKTPSPNLQTSIQITAHREANHYDYQEVWANAVEKVYVIKARFFNGGE